MKKIKYAISILSFLIAQSLFAQYTVNDIYAYIDQYKELAINKMYEYKIPASITMAQGILESACGKSRLAVEGNNHFGIKCHTDWTGDTILIDDDELQECFRKYENVMGSYNDHSLFLKNRPRYKSLFNLDIMDYEAWAKGLKAAGYATNPEYANILIVSIQRYNLAKLDTIYQERLAAGYFKDYPNVHPEVLAANDANRTAPQKNTNDKEQPTDQISSTQPSRPEHQPSKPHKIKWSATKEKQRTKPDAGGVTPKTNAPAQPRPAQRTSETSKHAAAPTPKEVAPEDPHAFTTTEDEYPIAEYPFTERKVFVNNRTYFVVAKEGDSFYKIAEDVQATAKQLQKFNDVNGATKLKVGQVVYIERKSKTGSREYYKVGEDETLQYVAQKSGVRLNKICQYNGLKPDAKIKKGDVIKLKK
ncbi:MAG: glucosaminidase domain-containing protein [Bacteroidales bacterium]|nr:glucosaminidase domain-containing protein [Bacteroidales bacterium]